jgi:hypothetical protein
MPSLIGLGSLLGIYGVRHGEFIFAPTTHFHSCDGKGRPRRGVWGFHGRHCAQEHD